jgi:Acylphosphatases
MSAPIRCHIWVEGRVQGVGYRIFTMREARRLGLVGYVRNLPDGRVEAVIEGDRKVIDLLLGRLQQGPRHARVERIERVIQEPTGEFQQFEIRR